MKKCFAKRDLKEFIAQLAADIAADCGDDFCLLGIRKGGVEIVDAMAAMLKKQKATIDVGYIDVSLYRDDIHRRLPTGPMEGTDISFSLENRTVVLVDEVLHTGRTIRAAIGQVMALGRPRFIKLAALVDRCGRELPIQADYSAVVFDEQSSGTIEVKCQGGSDDGIYFEKTAQTSKGDS